jgi:hypothetical protein
MSRQSSKVPFLAALIHYGATRVTEWRIAYQIVRFHGDEDIGLVSYFSPEDGGYVFFRNVGIYLQVCVALQPTRPTPTSVYVPLNLTVIFLRYRNLLGNVGFTVEQNLFFFFRHKSGLRVSVLFANFELKECVRILVSWNKGHSRGVMLWSQCVCKMNAHA